MSESWPTPPGGWLDIDDIGDVLSDDEIRALGFEPTPRGWRRIWPHANEGRDQDTLPGEDWRRQLRRRFA